MTAVYLDHNATMPLDATVLAAMTPYLTGEFGNPSSLHDSGIRARRAVEEAREKVAAAIGARPSEIIFTSSGTESNNTIIKGVAARALRGTVAVAATEHRCVLCAARALQRGGLHYIPLAVDGDGLLQMDDLQDALGGDDCALVSVMLANNETGVIQNIAEIAEIAHRAGAKMHTDAAQALGKIPVDFAALGVDAMTLSAHKMGGPKGIAALVARGDLEWTPLLDGGGQENERRSGTENVAGIVGMGAAAALAADKTRRMRATVAALRDEIEAAATAAGATVFGDGAPRLPNTTMFGFADISGQSLLLMLNQSGFEIASGAACSSMKNDPSHVLLAMGADETTAHSAVRVSLGAFAKKSEIEKFIAAVAQIVQKFATMSAVSV